MTLAFLLAALYCSIVGLFIWFFPETLIKLNDWFTEKTLLHEKAGIIYRIIIGGLFIAIAAIFWYVLLG